MSMTIRLSCDAEGCGYEQHGTAVPDGKGGMVGVTVHRDWRVVFEDGCALFFCPDHANRAAPDRTAPEVTHNFSTSHLAHTTNRKGPSQMREMSKGEGCPTGSNPAGVASSSAENHSASPDCTELSTVPTHNPPTDPMLAGGLRRCKVPVNPPSAPVELCDVVLSIGARCEVCVGSRCYPHCGGVGHLPHARQLSRGGAGHWEWSLWSVREATIGYRGQLCRRDPDGSSRVVRSFGGSASEEVMGRLLVAVDTAIEDGLASMNRAQDVLPAAGDDVAPGILALAKLSARLRERIEDIRHSAERRRSRLLDSVIEWLRQTEGAWEAEALAPDVNPRLLERAKQLHDSQLVDLFARIGGAL